MWKSNGIPWNLLIHWVLQFWWGSIIVWMKLELTPKFNGLDQSWDLGHLVNFEWPNWPQATEPAFCAQLLSKNMQLSKAFSIDKFLQFLDSGMPAFSQWQLV